MPTGAKLARRVRRLPIVALVLACALLPASAFGMSRGRGASDLSPRLAELAKPSLRSAPEPLQAAKLSLAAEGPGSLLREGNRVLVDVRFDHGVAASLDALRAAGAKIVDVSRRYQTVTAAVVPAELRRLVRVARVDGVTEVLTPMVFGTGNAGPLTSVTTPCFGAATSEGDEQLRAAQARSEFEVDGSGVTVGVLSDSFDQATLSADGSEPIASHAAEDVESGDLPGPGNPCGHETPVDVVEDYEPGPEEPEPADEGRAMAQIVHDLAPGASLAFATAFKGELSFAENVERLAAPSPAGADAKVIADDVSYFEEPFFQEGPVGVAVSNVTASGVAYFSSAGNNNLFEGSREIASWEAPEFRDSGNCPPSLVTLSEEIEEAEGPGTGLHPSHCMDFNPESGVDRTFGITVASGATLIADLQWAEPWEGVNTDIDTFLLNSKGQVIGGSIEDNVGGSKRPFELVGWENESGAQAEVQLVINRYSGIANPPLKFALLENGGGVTATQKSIGSDVAGPTIFGHNGGEYAMSIGAIRYSTTAAPEKFSSRGPVTHYFGPVEGTSPAPKLGSPQVLSKPDLVTTDGGASTFFASCMSGVWRFFGTSAAAPHAAAVAALEREAKPAESVANVEKAQREAAVEVGTFPPQAVGSGLLDAVGALEQLGVTPSSPGTVPSPPPSPVSCPPEPTPEPSPAPGPTPVPAPIVNSTANRALRTFFRLRPPKLIRTRLGRAKAVFVFGANESDVTFVCRIDGGLFRPCPTRLVMRFKPGRHSVRAVARDAAGNADKTPAVYRFRVERID